MCDSNLFKLGATAYVQDVSSDTCALTVTNNLPFQ